MTAPLRVLLCSGQAGQQRELLDEFCRTPLICPPGHPWRRLHDEANTLLHKTYGQDLQTWWHSVDAAALFANRHAQFAIVLGQLARWSALVHGGAEPPALLAGYSLGELSAYCCAGALSSAATLELAMLRGGLMDEAAVRARALGSKENPCLVLWRGRSTRSTRLARDALMAKLGLYAAIWRSAEEVVIGGSPQAVKDFMTSELLVRQPDCRLLPVTVPSHTPILQEAAAAFGQILAATELRDPQIPVLSSLTARLVRTAAEARQVLAAQIAQTLRWDWCVESLLERGGGSATLKVLELGPGNDLSKLLVQEATSRNLHYAADGRFSHALEAFAEVPAAISWWNADS